MTEMGWGDMDFQVIAKDFNEAYGFNILPLEGKRPALNSWEQWQKEKQDGHIIDSFPWHKRITGIGVIAGVDNLRTLDFDGVTEDIVVEKFIYDLGLPEKYEWVVRSGSNKGFHIWFYCEDFEYLNKFLGGKKSYYVLKPKEKDYCDHIELRWEKCQTVIPPSKHTSGKIYSFVNGSPKNKPTLISAGELMKALKKNVVIKEEKPPVNKEPEEYVHITNNPKGKKLEILVNMCAIYLQGKIDNYQDWLKVGFACASLGESGRPLFLKLSLDNPRYNDTPEIINRKFSRLLKDYKGKINVMHLVQVAAKYGFVLKKTFWKYDDGNVYIEHGNLYDILDAEGFKKIYIGIDCIYVKLEENIIREISPVMAKDYALSLVEECKDEKEKKAVRNALIKRANSLFNPQSMEFLHKYEPNFLKDEKNYAYFFFKNCCVAVSKTSIENINYEDLERNIWANQKLKRDFNYTNGKAEYETFLRNICRNNEQRFSAFCSAIGYLLHKYKDPSRAKAVVLMDEKLSDNAYGRSGKGLFAKGINQLRNFVKLDGKNFRFDKNFVFQGVGLDTDIIYFDDVNKKFSFERLFSILTEGMTIEKKNKAEIRMEYEDAPKLLMSTNYTISGNDDSSVERQYILEFSDFYNKKHKPVDDFNHLLFDEWNESEWDNFYNFMLRCVQQYLRDGLITYDYVNLKKKKLIDSTSPEFDEFIEDKDYNVEYDKKELWEQFKKENEDFVQMKQNTFTKWIKTYCELYDLELFERKSGDKRYILYKEKVD